MKSTGPKHERETIIRFDEEGKTAEVYTASDLVFRRLKKRGFTPTEDNERSAVFVVPKRSIRLPVQPRKVLPPTPKQIAVREAFSKGLSSSGAANFGSEK